MKNATDAMKEERYADILASVGGLTMVNCGSLLHFVCCYLLYCLFGSLMHCNTEGWSFRNFVQPHYVSTNLRLLLNGSNNLVMPMNFSIRMATRLLSLRSWLRYVCICLLSGCVLHLLDSLVPFNYSIFDL